MNSLVLVILLPTAAALLGFLFYRLRNEFSFIGTVLTLYLAFRIFLITRTKSISFNLGQIFGTNLTLYADAFTGLFLLLLAFWGLMLILYSFRYTRKLTQKQQTLYYFYLIAILAGSNGLVLSKSLILLLLFLGSLVFTSYGMVVLGRKYEEKVFATIGWIQVIPYLIIGLGIVLLVKHTGVIETISQSKIPLNRPLPIIIFILLAIGILARIVLYSFSYWTPKVVNSNFSSTISALTPAIINNFLGTYLFIRILLALFDFSSNLELRYILMTLGALTVLILAVKALVSNSLIHRLSYYSASQVGYIILGISTLTPIGIAGGVFQSVNNLIYLSVLVLTSSSVEFRTKTQDLKSLGGLATKMVWTFGAFLVAAFALAGIPPLNGFFSQAMILQGIFSLNNLSSIILFSLVILGSIIILVSVLKLIQTIFLGTRPQSLARTIEVGFSMNLPPIILALLCLILGIFAQRIAFNFLILSSLRPILSSIIPAELFSSKLITIIMITWLTVGILIYLITIILKIKSKSMFVGGEESNHLRRAPKKFEIKNLIFKIFPEA